MLSKLGFLFLSVLPKPTPKEMVSIKSSRSVFLWGLRGKKVSNCSGGWLRNGAAFFLLDVEVLSEAELSET